jgi:hypothetical protein
MRWKKSEMGRPPKRPADRRSAVVNVRLTEAERKKLEAAARKTDETLSEVLMRPWRKKEIEP